MLYKLTSLLMAAVLMISASACASAANTNADETVITLSDSGVRVDGQTASTSASSAVYVGENIIYYESGRGDSYGEGAESDGHDAAEASAHTVITITQPGTYRVSGVLSRGQLAVDLGEDAGTDPEAVVTLILDGADITCTVAPAVIFYNVYECGSTETETASATVDTSAAGANVILADGTENNITGSYVARIYKEGTTKKLHKYDGALYSKMSMNVTGESAGTGVLNITAENEGLDSELHLTINGGMINIIAQNDGINTNEDGVSVTTVNAGTLWINAGLGSEGDGIDSNGFLVINGGTLISAANPSSGDGGLDSDMGIYINGGTVFAGGSRNDSVETTSRQTYMELTFTGTVTAGSTVTLKDASGATVLEQSAIKDFSSLILSTPDLRTGGTYALYVDGVKQQYTGTGTGGFGGPGGMGAGARPDEGIPEGQTPPDLPEDWEPTEGPARGGRPEDMGDMTPPEGVENLTPPDGEHSGRGRQSSGGVGPTAFTITAEGGAFSGVSNAAELPFTDVEEDSDCYEAVRYLYGKGIMNGTSDTAFSPGETVSRAMAVTVLARLAGAEAQETENFSDVVSGSWYGGYVGWAVTGGIVQGDGSGSFLPDQAVTGEQLELMLTRYADSLGRSYTTSDPSTSPLSRGELALMLMDFALS